MLGHRGHKYLVARRLAVCAQARVIEVAFDGLQDSSRYPGGLALRFARIKGYRTDKTAEQADTMETVRAIHERSS